MCACVICWSMSVAMTAGATALTAASKVAVRTLNGVTTYSAVYAGTGTRTTVTVNAAGILANLPGNTTVNYSTIPSAAKTSLQSLATTAGYIGTIPDTQSVNAYDEANGTTIYTVTLAVTDSSGTTTTRNVSISVDQIGNPTVSPRGGGEGGCHGHGGFGFGL